MRQMLAEVRYLDWAGMPWGHLADCAVGSRLPEDGLQVFRMAGLQDDIS